MDKLTQARLRALLHYDPETGVFRWLVATGRRVKAGQEAGCLMPSGYVGIRIDNRRYMAHRLAWLYMTGEWPTGEIDHINGRRTINEWRNLRVATSAENKANARTPSHNTSGHKGVTFHKRRGKWAAQIHVNGKHIALGLFDNKEDAAAAYWRAARERFGQFARAA